MIIAKNLAVFSFALMPVLLHADEGTIKWPTLANVKHMKNKSATHDDVNAGRAAFAAVEKGKPVGKPIKMTIPQYAFHIEGEKKNPVVIIQAEEVRGIKMIGAINLSGTGLAATLEEFELLGTDQKLIKKK